MRASIASGTRSPSDGGLDPAHLAHADVRVGEPRVLAGDRDVGVGDVVEPAARAHAVDRDDHRHLEPAPGEERELVVDVVAERAALAVEARPCRHRRRTPCRRR